MQIILSHDIDHLYWKHHYYRDLIIAKHIYRHTKSWILKEIDTSLYLNRLKITGRLNRIPELIEFHKQNNTTGCFFFGMDNALGLSYYPEEASIWIKYVIENGHDAGVHGISFSDRMKISKEYELFKKLSGLETFGIRTHYLRMNGYTLEIFAEQGYMFDTTIQGISHPFKLGGMLEIPMSIMDSILVSNSQSNQNIEQWKFNTKKRLDKAEYLNIPYFVINHHDAYFDKDTFPIIYDWYHWLMDEIKERKLVFTTFREAVNQLNNK